MKGLVKAGLGVMKQAVVAVDMNELARQGLDMAEAAVTGGQFTGSFSGVFAKAMERIDLKSVLKTIVRAALGR